MKNLICVYSGGMDSFTLLRLIHRQLTPDQRLHALSFDYGQRHRRELQIAAKVCSDLHISHQVIDLTVMRSRMGGSALTDDRIDVPHGHYEAESMKQTVVPGRNTVMLACALAFAEGINPNEHAVIYYGAHAGDHHIYPDCRPGYISSMKDAFWQGSDHRVRLSTPFQSSTKGDILVQGLQLAGLGADDYADTWTCYEGGTRPCGECGACQERQEAFAFAGVLDPLVAAPAGLAELSS